MTSFRAKRLIRRQFINRLVEFSRGLDEMVVERILIYAETLLMPGTEEVSNTAFRSQMFHQFNLSNSLMISMIFGAIKISSTNNHNKSRTLEEYCKLICIYLSPNLDLKTDFVFKVYDVDCATYITRSEASRLLKPTFICEDEDKEDMLKELTDLVMKTADPSNTGVILANNFKELVKRDRLYLQLLGQCLPDDIDILRFRRKLTSMTTEQLKDVFESEKSPISMQNLVPITTKEYYSVKLEF